MKILFTSVGRRVELMQAFRNASAKIDIPLEIYGADLTDSAPALFFCHQKVVSPRIKDEIYIPFLHQFCRDNSIDLLIPTIDTDLLLLSEHKYQFGNTKVLISDPEKIRICRDKRKTSDYFNHVGLLCPHPVDDINSYTYGFPAFIKPKDGSSSIFAYKANSEAELIGFSKHVPDYIIQPYIQGTEYTIDIMCDFYGNPIFITPRIRLAVRSGEVLKSEIRQDDRIISEMLQLISDYRPCGPITVQMIREENTGLDYYIEINPRFGGGVPLSIASGADSAEMLLRLMNGEKLHYFAKAAEDGAVFSRFDQSIRIK